RELCCSTWLTDFKSVNTTAARYQNLSINQSKLSGQCGRLKCCLNYELDTYLDALQNFPDNADSLQVAKGTASLVKKDIFKNLMWYVLPDSNKQYPLTIERVRKIRQLNLQNQVPDTLDPVEVSTGKPKEVESPYVDLVGQISLKTLEKADRKKKHGQHKHQPQHGSGRREGSGGRGSEGSGGRGGESSGGNSGRGGEGSGGRPEGGGNGNNRGGGRDGRNGGRDGRDGGNNRTGAPGTPPPPDQKKS
ncbi:MAG TPA: regulatory iron-sulfur-containing complex subunit RicT, partial [Puia sp.]